MASQTDFNKFMSDIEPSQTTVSYISSVQTNLRKFLSEHATYSNVHIDTFLSGSYAKHTAIRPVLYDSKRDVDIVVVTSYTKNDKPSDILDELKNTLLESSKYDTASIDGQAVSIQMDGISIDVVPMIVDETDEELYYVGDCDSEEWIKTDPKGHKGWATQVNKDHNNEFKPLVKIFKWWRRVHCTDDSNYPKGIALERIVADNIGDTTLPTENLIISTMQNIIQAYKEPYVDEGTNPVIDDPSDKIDGNDLLAGYSISDFQAFVETLIEHVTLLEEEGVDNTIWKKILGDRFPAGTATTNSLTLYNAQQCIAAPHKQKPRWPISRGAAVFIAIKVCDMYGNKLEYQNNGIALPKHCELSFTALVSVNKPYDIYWQIVNTGNEARAAGGLRGGFEPSDIGANGKKETTLYAGVHSVECFVIKKGICVARSKPFIINIQ